MKWAGFGAIAALVGIVARPGAAMTGQFATGVSLVEVYATVTGRDGRPVDGLTAADFIVEEDGHPQRIDAFAQGEFPLAVAVGIDRSFSIEPRRLAASVLAAKRFVEGLRADDQVMVLGVGGTIEVLAPLSTDHRAAVAALDRVDRWGTTPLYDAVLQAIEAVQPAPGRRALVLLSDGADRYSTTSAPEMIGRARTRDVLVYPVATDNRPAPVLAELATTTGGRSFVTTERQLSATLAAIGDELRHQYLLGYTPASNALSRRSAGPAGEPGEAAGRWRSIRVRVKRPGVRVRARDGYRAP